MCNPGKQCLVCEYKDCIMTSVHRVYPEETEMLKVAGLPSSSEGKKKHRRVTDDASKERRPKKTVNSTDIIIPHFT